MRVVRVVGSLVGVVVLVGTASTAASPLRGAPFDPRAAPTVSGFSPASGAAGTAVVITGSGFANASDVRFNGTSGLDVSIDSRTQITVTVPLGATTGRISVVTPKGTATSSEAFEVIPIQHIVIVDEENHSFNDMFGKFCVDQASGALVRAGVNDGCVGTDVGKLDGGASIGLTSEPNGGLNVNHSIHGQQVAIDGGKMDGFSKIAGCTAQSHPAYGCYTQYDPLGGPCGSSGTATCIPNIVQWARKYAISDQTFEFRATPSWAGHMVLGDATIESFVGDNPSGKPAGIDPTHSGWGCDSGHLVHWRTSSQTTIRVPSCVPDHGGSLGPLWDGTQYASDPHAGYVPTIFDRLDGAGRPWRIYGGGGRITGPTTPDGYKWTICPTFWECLGSSQIKNLVPVTQLATDAAAGRLPAVSFVTPHRTDSMHQPTTASTGDNWLAKSVIGPLMHGPEWPSTAIFLTWDDCGCFYDPVAPPSPEWGIRVPLQIVSPYARAGYTDSRPATFVSMLAFIEHTYGLAPLNPCATVGGSGCTDDTVGLHGTPMYDYMNAFDFSQTPLGPTRIVQTTLDAYDRKHLAAWSRRAGDEDT